MFLLLLLLLTLAQYASAQGKAAGLKCWSNGDGTGVPSSVARETTCNAGEWCVAKNYYGDMLAAQWPLDDYGEKCYRYCAKMDIRTADAEQEYQSNTWSEDYQDDEQTIRQYSQDTGIHLTMTCYDPGCNKWCMDEDSSLSLTPNFVMMLGICVAMWAQWVM